MNVIFLCNDILLLWLIDPCCVLKMTMKKAMVNFCYNNELPKSVELMSQLSIIADRFLIPSLANLCQQKLGIILAAEECPKTALKAFPFALKYNTMYLGRHFQY